jgi:hypothetical protein
MRRVGRNSYTEIYFPGCNPSFVETSDGYVHDDRLTGLIVRNLHKRISEKKQARAS